MDRARKLKITGTYQKDLFNKAVAPAIKLGAAMWAAYGFAKIITRRGAAIPFCAKYFYETSDEGRIATVAQAHEGTLEVIRNRLKRNAQDGGKMMLQAFGMVLVVLQFQDDLAQIEQEINYNTVLTAASGAASILRLVLRLLHRSGSL